MESTPNFQEYKNSQGEIILYCGKPNLNMLERLSLEEGDIWHSSFEEGYKNAFPEIVYQTAVFFWYGFDFDNLEKCVSWRMSPNNFAIRKRVWEQLFGFDKDYNSPTMQALDFAYNALRNGGVVPLYVKTLFRSSKVSEVKISALDRYIFYRKNFKSAHSYYMLFRKGIWNFSEWNAFLTAQKKYKKRKPFPKIQPRKLEALSGNPTVSYIIPTMFRQDYTLQLLEDLKAQTYLPSQVIVVDATPEDSRNENLYTSEKYPFEVQFHWQTTKGSCRARNEAIAKCKGDYIIFGDDDIRISPNFIENHLRLLQTYRAVACNGLDIRADNENQNLEDLAEKLEKLGAERWFVGASNSFSNANSCVKREHVDALIGNDINYDGGYGEDSDFGISLTKMGVTVLHNPFSANLHLKPPAGGYRFWGSQAKVLGKKRKKQPWELDNPVGAIRPVPSPTLMYQFYKQFNKTQRAEYKRKYFLRYLSKGSKWVLPLRILKLPYKILQYKKSTFYAKQLMKLGKRTA
ncbi:glycosyltransferase family 2 protein [Aequorivita echinoideorum]|uniref:Glycosyltransferase n=1 Tax=Aequorivita echinoideorum TaxID=1549647 RepID=A0ABS5S5G5_9FLAO|nr:glycosyltransferase [Aequorivita echinoideorum]MBT0608461.1 glycosyltransferase [Aequorivita echinoideorum]